MEPNNPVVKLCAAGMEAEGEGRLADAAALFMQAWDTAQGDYEACIAAHYVARRQPTPEQTLYWNQVAVDRAECVADGSAAFFFPSLYLNLGMSHETLGDRSAARFCYEQALKYMDALPEGSYSSWVRAGVARALGRTAGQPAPDKE
ncbi:MAG: hypothetical protein IT329_09220 [Caldilineaceae bacterium]|nr:hypothetical protein [Caldilineaceae bacterium]